MLVDLEKIKLNEAFLFMLGYALMTVGILYPEAKNTIVGVPWPWVFVLLAYPIFLKSIISNKLNRSVIFVYYLNLVGVGVWVIIATLAKPDYVVSSLYLFKVIPILFLTVPLSAILFNSIPSRNLFLMLDWAALILCFLLLIVRMMQNDFTREGFFLGFGPLTFIKYVGLGFVVRILILKSFNIIPLALYAFAFYISDSKGPMLFILLTFVVVAFSSPMKDLLKIAALTAVVVFGLSQNSRVQAFLGDISTIDLTSQITILDQQVANEEISGTLVRLGSIFASIELIKSDPVFGAGPGSWPTATNLPSVEYPHNIFLEIFSEIGLVGFVILVFLYLCVGVAVRYRRYREYAIPAIFAGLTATTSGSLPDFRFFLIFFLLLMLVPRSDIQHKD